MYIVINRALPGSDFYNLTNSNCDYKNQLRFIRYLPSCAPNSQELVDKKLLGDNIFFNRSTLGVGGEP